MPFNRDTLTQIIARNDADISANLTGGDATLRRSVLNVLSRMQAGAEHGLYGYIGFSAKQLFVTTCDQEYIIYHAQEWGVPQKTATQATGTVTITGTNGTVIPQYAELKRADGTLFKTQAVATIASGLASITVKANVAANAGNTIAGTVLTFVSPPAGANGQATVATGGLIGGTDLEDPEDWRARIILRKQKPAQGGNVDDYINWALAYPGVTRAWAKQELGAGTVTVRFMMDNTYANGIPSASDVTALQSYFDQTNLRPVTDQVYVVAPIASPLNLTIDLLVTDTTAVRNAVTAELTDMLRRDAVPGGTIYQSRINEAISLAIGEYAHTLTSPTTDQTYATGYIATLGTITWI